MTVEAALYAAKKDEEYGLLNGSWPKSSIALAKNERWSCNNAVSSIVVRVWLYGQAGESSTERAE